MLTGCGYPITQTCGRELVCVNHATVVKCESLFSRVTEALHLHIRDCCLNACQFTDVIRINKQTLLN